LKYKQEGRNHLIPITNARNVSCLLSLLCESGAALKLNLVLPAASLLPSSGGKYEVSVPPDADPKLGATAVAPKRKFVPVEKIKNLDEDLP